MRGLPDTDLAADMYDMTQEMTARAGFGAYEVSNHAAAGAESRHNMIYWRQGDYAGIGPGAHGRLTLAGTRMATEALHAPGAWLHAVENASDFETVTVLSQNGQLSEHIMMGLRLTEGLDIERLERFPDIPLNEQAVSELEALGMLWRREGRLGATMQGRLVLNSVIAELMPD